MIVHLDDKNGSEKWWCGTAGESGCECEIEIVGLIRYKPKGQDSLWSSEENMGRNWGVKTQRTDIQDQLCDIIRPEWWEAKSVNYCQNDYLSQGVVSETGNGDELAEFIEK